MLEASELDFLKHEIGENIKKREEIKLPWTVREVGQRERHFRSHGNTGRLSVEGQRRFLFR